MWEEILNKCNKQSKHKHEFQIVQKPSRKSRIYSKPTYTRKSPVELNEMEQINRIWEEEETAPTIPEKDTYQQPPMFVCAWAFLLFFCYLVLIKLIEFSVVTPCLKSTQHQHTYNHNVSSSHTLLFSFLPLNMHVYVCVRIPVIPF